MRMVLFLVQTDHFPILQKNKCCPVLAGQHRHHLRFRNTFGLEVSGKGGQCIFHIGAAISRLHPYFPRRVNNAQLAFCIDVKKAVPEQLNICINARQDFLALVAHQAALHLLI